jgi:UDP-N-acetyl-D-mannosaminuronic acid transferase (WecB/TagA/CpsF family)
MNVGGFLDFVSGFETRAPERMVKAKVLETPYRIFSHPSKNMQKFIRMFGILRIRKSQLVNSLRCLFRKK